MSVLSLAIVSLGITLILAQLPASSQDISSKSSPWMQQADQGKQLYQNQQYTEALQVWQGLVAGLKDDGLNRAMALSNLSLTYQQLGQWQEAEQAVLTSRRSLETIAMPGADRVLAQTLDIQGRLHLLKGQPEQALAVWHQSEQLYTHLNDPAAIAQSQINQAQALQSSGNYVLAQKRLTQATQTLQNQSDSSLKATGFRSLGNVLRQMGELEKSRQKLQAAREIAHRSQLPQLEAETLLDLGNLEYSQAKRFEAIARTKFAKKSAQLAQQYFQDVIQQTDKLPTLKLRALLNDLSLSVENKQLIEDKQFSLSLDRFSTLQPLLDSVPLGRFSVYARLRYIEQEMNLMWISSHNKNNLSSSLQPLFAQAKTALQQARQLQDQQAEAQALGMLGKLYAKNQQNAEAVQLTERAVSLANTPDLIYQFHWQMGRLLAQQPDNQNANLKSANLKSAIAHYTLAIRALDCVRHNLLAANPDVQFSFRDQVKPIYRELVDLLLTNPTPAHLKQAVESVDALQLAELEDFLHCPIAQQDRLTEFNDPTAAIIYPILLPNRLAIILQLPGQPLIYESTPVLIKALGETRTFQLRHKLIYESTPVPIKAVEEALIKFRQVLADPAEAPKVKPLARQIYDWILQPIAARLEQSGVTTLVFAPDGLLRNIPLAALHDGKNYLVQGKYAIAIASKLKLFEPKPTPSELAVFTGGVGEAQTIEIAGESQSFMAIKSLEPELLGIGGKNSIAKIGKPLLNAQFTINNLQAQFESNTFSAVHIKTHGKFSSDPDSTFIVAHGEPIKSQTFRELIQLASKDKTSPLELLVLSACHSAEGDDRAVLGLAGIAATGARSAIAALWDAQDEPNTKLMIQLYQELSKPGTTKSRALQLAQQSIYQDDNRPFIWAPYVLVGNWQ
jgi:CHAT domain-containing protein